LNAGVANGTFRHDLLYRLNVFPIEMPPLRERKDDVLMLVEYFVQRYANRTGRNIRSIDKKTLDLLQSYDWPGNIRELQNAVEHALAIGIDATLAIADLPMHISGMVSKSAPPEPVGEGRTLDEVERRHILRILEETSGNHLRAAEILGIHRRTLYRKLEKYKIVTDFMDK
jgi:transcriptional regulator with PAS, ATPase and Fis domain